MFMDAVTCGDGRYGDDRREASYQALSLHDRSMMCF